jgi:phosphate:Na+ symporter
MFNIANVLILGLFALPIATLVTKIIKQKNTDEEFKLTHISTGLLSTSELSVLQAQKEIEVYAERVQKMFGLVKEYYVEKSQTKQTKLFARITKYEHISDRMELEIAAYLTELTSGQLGDDSKAKVHKMLRMISEIESLADSCHNTARVIERGRLEKVSFTKSIDAGLAQMFTLIDDALINMLQVLELMDEEQADISKSQNLENEINYCRNQLKLQNVSDVKKATYQYNTSIIYMDMIVELEKMGDYIINIVEVATEGKE